MKEANWKFKDIQVGDTVYMRKSVSYGWGQGRGFTIPVKVIRVTKTQFVVEGGNRYQKEWGTSIGDYGSAKKEGEDQSKEMKEFAAHVKLMNSVYSRVRDIQISIDIDNEVLKEFDEFLKKHEEALGLLKKQK